MPAIYLTSLTNYLFPFIIFFIYIVIKIFVCRKKSPRSILATILLNLFISIYIFRTNLIKSTLLFLDCEEIETGSLYLSSDLSENCSNDRFKNFLFRVAIPALVFYLFLLPLSYYVYLWKERKTIFDLKVMKRFGFLVIGYNKDNYLW